jgi:hypothetical protein
MCFSSTRWIASLAGVVVGFALGSGASADSPISLDIATADGLPVNATQEWYKVLADLDLANVRIHAGEGESPVEFKSTGESESARYTVYGVINSRRVLVLPGAKFTLDDRAGLRKWLDHLAEHGPPSDGPRTVFGLDADQFKQVHDDLVRPVGFKTLGMPRGEAIAAVVKEISVPLVDDGLLPAEDRVTEELADLSAGTALAYLLRTDGLSLIPRLSKGRPQLVIRQAQADEPIWPVGWEVQGNRQRVAPKLFETLTTEIKDTPLSETLEAIGGRLKMVYLYDQYALVRSGIELDQVTVEIPETKAMYFTILNRALSQARLKGELRADEAGQPFFWITTVAPVKE